MITFYYCEILICHFLLKIWRTCVICLNWIISLKTQHVSKAQTPHTLIISILTKTQHFLTHLLSGLTFLTTIVWFVQCFARHFVKVQQNLYTKGLCNNYNKEQFKNVLKQRLVSSGNSEECFYTFLATLNEHAPLKKERIWYDHQVFTSKKLCKAIMK